MTTAQVVETSVIVNNNSPIQDYVHPDDQIQPTFAIGINGNCGHHFHLLLRHMNVVYNRPRYDSNLPLDPLGKPSDILCSLAVAGEGRDVAAVSLLGYRDSHTKLGIKTRWSPT